MCRRTKRTGVRCSLPPAGAGCKGVVAGRLLGGCLDVLEWVRGTSVWPNLAAWQGAILFIETSEDAPSPQPVQRALRAYGSMGILARLAGIIVGRPGGEIPAAHFADYDAAILRAVADEQGLTDLPIVSGMDFGHTDPMMVLPYGVQAQLDCTAQTFSILESGVIE